MIGRIVRMLGSSPILAATVFSTPASSNETRTYAYDALGRLVTVESAGAVNDGDVNSLCYDPAGNRQVYQSSDSGSMAACVATGSSSASSSSFSSGGDLSLQSGSSGSTGDELSDEGPAAYEDGESASLDEGALLSAAADAADAEQAAIDASESQQGPAQTAGE